MKKTFIITLLIAFACVVSTRAQVKKPTLMVVPADNWCVKNGYMDTFNDQGAIVKVPSVHYKIVVSATMSLPKSIH